MSESTVTASIITFYNQMYMQRMKLYLLQFSPNSRHVPLSPAPKSGHSPCKISSPKQYVSATFSFPDILFFILS